MAPKRLKGKPHGGVFDWKGISTIETWGMKERVLLLWHYRLDTSWHKYPHMQSHKAPHHCTTLQPAQVAPVNHCITQPAFLRCIKRHLWLKATHRKSRCTISGVYEFQRVKKTEFSMFWHFQFGQLHLIQDGSHGTTFLGSDTMDHGLHVVSSS